MEHNCVLSHLHTWYDYVMIVVMGPTAPTNYSPLTKIEF